MSKNALVIKGANFATNKVTTIEFDYDEIPCTALSLSDSTKSVTALGDFTLTATKTPNNTTDELLWASSDTSVATVSGGTVSVVGLGTATITATCGEQTATCAVTCNEVTISPDYVYRGFSDLSSYPNYYAYATSSGGDLLICNLNTNESLRTLKNQTSDTSTKYAPIALPNNTMAISLSYGNNLVSGTTTIKFGWLDLNTPAYDGRDEAKCISIDKSNTPAYGTAATKIYEVEEGANSFAIVLRIASSIPGDTPAEAAASHGIVIKALSAVPST